MFISSRCKGGLFCLLSFLLVAISSVGGQLMDESKNGQNNKINSIKVNKIVTSDSVEQPADSDRTVIGNRNVNLNSKYVTQSAVTSGPSVGLYMGSKKSEYEEASTRKKMCAPLKLAPINSNCSCTTFRTLSTLLTCLEQLRVQSVWLHLIGRKHNHDREAIPHASHSEGLASLKAKIWRDFLL